MVLTVEAAVEGLRARFAAAIGRTAWTVLAREIGLSKAVLTAFLQGHAISLESAYRIERWVEEHGGKRGEEAP